MSNALPGIPLPLVHLLTSPHVAQRAFSWPKGRWTNWLSSIEGAAKLLDALPDAVDRQATATAVGTRVRRGAFHQ